ncbi:MFS transporter [Paractinoplanes globisporus]|uniref:MFS transporter n=1 Tax=Paractinoplanes globisporus TaxID=113565 RepID=A0ABW6WBI2_9ACTN|nr:MFS transporter [Actinoplanes globisporus]
MDVSVQRLGADFRRVWFATAVTSLGMQITAVALPLLAVLTLGVSPGQVGAIVTVQWLPFLLIALPLGVLFDRMRRRPLLVAAEIGRAVVLLALVVLTLVGALGFELLVALSLLLGCCSVLYEVGYQSYLPSLVPPERLDVANSRLQSTESVALIAGPGIGGLLVQAVSAAGALAVQVVTSAVSAMSLLRIRGVEAAPSGQHLRLLPAIAEGVRFLVRDPVLLWAVGFSAIYNPFEQWIKVLFTIDAVRRLGLTAGQFGLVLSIGAVGALLGAAVAPAVSRRLGALQACLWCAGVDAIFLVLPFAQPEWGTVVLISVLGGVFAANGFTAAISSVILLTVRQIRVPDALRGRVNATTRAISYGSITVGAAAGGLTGQLLGVRLGLTVGCIGVLASLVWTLGLGGVLLRRGTRIDVPTTGALGPN